MGDGIRIYSLVRTRNGQAQRWCRRLVGGIWVYGVTDVQDEAEAEAPVDSESLADASPVARVA